MGYRFSVETANTIANLSFGKVLSCYRDIFSTEDRFDEFMGFLNSFEKNLFIGNRENDDYWNIKAEYDNLSWRYKKLNMDRREAYHKTVHSLLIKLEERKQIRFESKNDYYIDKTFYYDDTEIIEHLSNLSDVLKRPKIKSLLLPGIYFDQENNNREFMTDVNTLNRLVRWHPFDSCLILQPKEKPSSKNITIFDTFPHFDYALRQLDLWPAVMFWNNRDEFVFAPVKSINELENMYAIIHFEKNNPFGELERFVAKEIKSKKSHYYLHLSDLHFGAKNTPVNGRRLKQLVKNQISSVINENNNSTINFLITGDLVDSPKKKNTTDYSNFYDFMSDNSTSAISPVFVLGNHDINNHGIAIGNNNQYLINSVGPYPKVKIDKEIKVIFLLFNSNSKGALAEGEIGVDQLSEMGNQLDKIFMKNKDICDYKKVAVLHHHLIKIPNPEWRTEHWYKKLIPSGFLEKTLRLRDAETFKQWLNNRGVKLVLHGHMHVPFIGKEGDINIVACGSSTGQIKNIDPQKTYISYNMLKFEEETVTCTLYAEDLLGSGAIDVQTSTLKY